MLLKISMPGQFQFRMIQDWKSVFFHRGGDIHYIGGAEILPPPLEPGEEAACIEKLGGEQNDKARNTLVEHNLRLVVYIAKKFDNTGVGVEDLISIGTIGLMKAINTFNPTKNIKLATYASRCIENEILMYLRRNNKTKLEVSIDEPLNVDWDGNELLLSDILGTSEDIIYKDIEKEANALLVKKLPEDMQPTYSDLLSEEDTPEHRCVKAADTLSAYIKCVEELKAGNREFEGAAKSIRERLEQLPLRSVRVFIDEFLESYSLTLDEQS